jgi:hypothetical protein
VSARDKGVITRVCPTVGVSLNNTLRKQHSNHCLLRSALCKILQRCLNLWQLAPSAKNRLHSNICQFTEVCSIFSEKINRNLIFVPAKTLKKAWVEKTKIKSKWKAQKRKEGLESTAKLDLPVYDEVEESSVRSRLATNDKPDDTSGEDLGASPQAHPQTPRAQASHLHPSRAHIHPAFLSEKLRPTPPLLGRKTEQEAKIIQGGGG